MSNILEVLSNIKSTSSGTGMSYYSEQCSRRHHLKLAKTEEDTEERFAADTGVVFHRLMELYYTGQLGNTILPYADSPDPKDPVQEALRLFRSYKDKFPADEWTTITVEQLLDGPAVEAAVGGVKFTARVDVIIELNEKQCADMKKRRKLDLYPGRYLVDHKTHKQKDSMAVARYNMSTQFASYHMAWNALHPAEAPLLGTIVNEVLRHVDLDKQENGGWRSFVSHYIPAPGEHDRKVIVGHLQRQSEFLKKNEPNLTACIGYRVCAFYLDGSCDRT